MTWRATFFRPIARHVTDTRFDPRYMSCTALRDVESNSCETLGGGGTGRVRRR